MTTTDRARSFLRDLLAPGPRPSTEVRRAAAAAGLAWRTVEAAKAAIGAESTKGPSGWSWALSEPKAATPQHRNTATPQAVTAAATPTLAALLAQVEGLARRVAALEAAADLGPPDPKRRGALVDLRRNPGGRIGAWGAGRLVRCADCRHAADLADDGHCGRGDRSIRWPFAWRNCPAFEPAEAV